MLRDQIREVSIGLLLTDLCNLIKSTDLLQLVDNLQEVCMAFLAVYLKRHKHISTF